MALHLRTSRKPSPYSRLGYTGAERCCVLCEGKWYCWASSMFIECLSLGSAPHVQEADCPWKAGDCPAMVLLGAGVPDKTGTNSCKTRKQPRPGIQIKTPKLPVTRRSGMFSLVDVVTYGYLKVGKAAIVRQWV